jgi:hypothetical protein
MLHALGIPKEAVAGEVDASREVVISTTNSRSLLGTLNDFAFLLAYRLYDEPDADLLEVAIGLSRTPVSPLAGVFPDRVTRQLLTGDEGGAPPASR